MIILPPPLATWPEAWQPVGDDTWQREPFPEWWTRLKGQLPPLDPRVYEQWMHRHWRYSPYFGHPLDNLGSASQIMTTQAIIDSVGSPSGGLGDPQPSQLDVLYSHLNKPGFQSQEPWKTMNATGTWNFPILLLSSRDGFRVRVRDYSSPFWLIEGHQRLRYLKVLASKGNVVAHHEVIVLQPGD